MGNIDMSTKAGSQFDNVYFSQLQPARGPFRALMLWARASDGVILPRGGSLTREAAEFVEVVREGKAANAAIVDVALGKARGDSSLGGDLAKLKAQIEAFYADLDMPAASDINQLVEVVRQFQAGLQEPDEVLDVLVATLPAPTRLIHPRSYDLAYRLVEGVTLLLYLRRMVTRLIATQDGITTRLGSRSERQYERQNVVFLGQLELACAVADDELRRLAEAEGDDPVYVSAALVRAFAERARRMGHPLAVREAPLGAGVVRDAMVASQGLPQRAASLGVSIGQSLREVGVALGGAGQGVRGLLLVGGSTLGEWIRVMFDKRPQMSVALAGVAIVLIAILAVSTWQRIRVTWVGIPAAQASEVGGRSAVHRPLSSVNEQPPIQVMVALRTVGPVSLEDVARFFGLNSDQAIHFLSRYNAAVMARLDKRLIKGDLYTTPLPSGTILYVPTVNTSATRSLADLAAEYGVTVEGIQRMNAGSRKDSVLTPVGYPDKLPDRKQQTEPVEFRVGQTQFQPGKLVD